MRMTTVCGAVLALICLLISKPAAEPPSFDSVKRDYDQSVDRVSLNKRWRGMVKLADTRDQRAFDILAKRYERPDDPGEALAYVVVEVCATRFTDAKFADAWDAWAKRNTHDRDAWLWFNAAKLVYAAKGSDSLIESVQDAKLSPYLRAAVIEALATKLDDKVLALVPAWLDALPDKGAERAVMLEACGSLIRAHSTKIDNPEYRALLERLALQLDDKKTEERSKYVLGRMLRTILKTDSIALESKPWVELLHNVEPKDPPKKPSRYSEKKPKFLGIEGAGKRVAYVIDLSDSMLIPLTAKEKEELKKPLTGEKRERKEGAIPPKEEPKDPKMPTEKDLPWDKINNRFEAAREFLKLSLRTLDKEMFFVIVGFGNDAETLTGKGIIPATKQNIDQAIRMLDEIKPGPAEPPLRPDGTLKGLTNLQGGMLRAFRAVTGNALPGEEHVAKTGFEQGVDTVFLLSDGAPSWDDYATKDKPDPDDIVGDPETGQPLPATEYLIFQGPYIVSDYLLQTISRMNLLRKCEIHCIGLGEANFTLLDSIAKIGRGQVRKVGNEK
ncbi:hypothetical protein PLCT1_00653 [Planctomycetaceae bacterium]|nr:hypothetical protein PLCT1_00653 [Planctomycetaceae bacterium]